MYIALGIILYCLFVFALSRFGKFMKDCDDQAPHFLDKEVKND